MPEFNACFGSGYARLGFRISSFGFALPGSCRKLRCAPGLAVAANALAVAADVRC
jgi:hypothetical protein